MDNYTRTVRCPSCDFASEVAIGPAKLDEWLGGPQLVCPWCQGHSDRSACLTVLDPVTDEDEEFSEEEALACGEGDDDSA